MASATRSPTTALIGAIAPNLTTDNGLSGLTLVKLAFDYRHADVGTAP